jgi:hypothetical protein
MNMIRWAKALICSGVILVAVFVTVVQPEAATESAPAPDPGYNLYYHDEQSAPNWATRWGYHDGWLAGRWDRSHGAATTSREKVEYLTPPDHGGRMARDQYQRSYRTAFVHGYEHGRRL